VLLILTKSVEKCFVKNAKFDMRPLLASTDSIFASLIHAFSWYVHNFVSNLHMDGYEFDLPCVWNIPDGNVVFDGILREKTSYTIIFNNLIL